MLKLESNAKPEQQFSVKRIRAGINPALTKIRVWAYPHTA